MSAVVVGAEPGWPLACGWVCGAWRPSGPRVCEPAAAVAVFGVTLAAPVPFCDTGETLCDTPVTLCDVAMTLGVTPPCGVTPAASAAAGVTLCVTLSVAAAVGVTPGVTLCAPLPSAGAPAATPALAPGPIAATAGEASEADPGAGKAEADPVGAASTTGAPGSVAGTGTRPSIASSWLRSSACGSAPSLAAAG